MIKNEAQAQELDFLVSLLLDDEWLLTPSDVLTLSCVNHSFFRIVSPKIANFSFYWPHDTSFKVLKPTKVIVYSKDTPYPFPDFVKSVRFSYMYDKASALHLLNPTIKKVSFPTTFNESLDFLPPGIVEISVLVNSMFNQPVDNLPHSLQVLKLSPTFTHPLDYLPPMLIKLDLSKSRNYIHPLDHLPQSLQELNLPNRYNQPLDHLPSKLKSLCFRCFNGYPRPLDHLPESLIAFDFNANKYPHHLDYLPNKLKKLTLAVFSQSLDHLPPSLTQLTLSDYNQPIDHLPPYLMELEITDESYVFSFHSFSLSSLSLFIPLFFIPCLFKFSGSLYFDRPVDHLPSNLHSLIIIGDFCQSLDHLPPSLKVLRVISNYTNTKYSFPLHHLPLLTHLFLEFGAWNGDIDHLPSSLIFFHLSRTNVVPSDLDHLPPKIIHLSLPFIQNSSFLPPSLSLLVFASAYQSTIFPASLTHLKIDHITCPFPPNLTHLHLDNYNFNHPFPQSLQYLQLASEFHTSLDGILPPFLVTLVLGKNYNQPIDHLPSTLKSLLLLGTLFGGFNQPIDHLPSSLTELYVGSSFNQSVDCLPPSLLLLSVGISFNRPINNLPRSLTELSLSSKFNQPIDFLPPNIQIKTELLLNCLLFNEDIRRIKFGSDFQHPVTQLPLSTRVILHEKYSLPHPPFATWEPTPYKSSMKIVSVV